MVNVDFLYGSLAERGLCFLGRCVSGLTLSRYATSVVCVADLRCVFLRKRHLQQQKLPSFYGGRAAALTMIRACEFRVGQGPHHGPDGHDDDMRHALWSMVRGRMRGTDSSLASCLER